MEKKKSKVELKVDDGLVTDINKLNLSFFKSMLNSKDPSEISID